jgi:hypothetical protein
LWASISLSAFLVVSQPWLCAGLFVIAVGATAYLMRLPSAEQPAPLDAARG